MKLMEKILSKNMYEMIYKDVCYYGVNFIRKEYMGMGILKTSNGITITTDRRNRTRVSDNGPYYICILKFTDILGRVILEMNFSENDAARMIDIIWTYEAEMYMQDIFIQLSNPNNPGGLYTITLDRMKTGLEDSSRFSIYESDPIKGNVPRVTFVLSDYEILNDFIFMMYFSYLIDIDANCDISLSECLWEAYLNRNNIDH